MSTETSVKSVSREAPSIYAIQQGSAYLKVGDVGDSVLTCRGLLNQKGYSCNLTSETYDSVLKSVVAKFQKDFGLTSDGLLGQSSLAVLQDNVSDTEWLVDGVVNITAGKLARMGFGKEVLKPANVTALRYVTVTTLLLRPKSDTFWPKVLLRRTKEEPLLSTFMCQERPKVNMISSTNDMHHTVVEALCN